MVVEIDTSFTEFKKEYLMRFTNGEQYIDFKVNADGEEIIEEQTKDYFWQEREAYNLLLPLYNNFIARGGNNERWYGVVNTLVPFQKEYNKLKNKRAELMNRIAMGILAVEDGSVDTDNLEEEGLAPGKVLVYRQGSTPPVVLQTAKPEDIMTFENIERALLERFHQTARNLMILKGEPQF